MRGGGFVSIAGLIFLEIYSFIPHTEIYDFLVDLSSKKFYRHPFISSVQFHCETKPVSILVRARE